MTSQKMLNYISASLSHSVKYAHGISHEHRMNHILLKLLDILLLNCRFNSFIISIHVLIFIIRLLILWVMGIVVLLWQHNLVCGQIYSAPGDSRELAIATVVIYILVFVEKVFDTVIQIITES
jgi:hypothetical protein